MLVHILASLRRRGSTTVYGGRMELFLEIVLLIGYLLDLVLTRPGGVGIRKISFHEILFLGDHLFGGQLAS